MDEHRCLMGYVIEDDANAEERFYVLAFPELTIYGHTIDHYTRERYPEDWPKTQGGRRHGVEFGCWHSVACAEGEIGSNTVDGLRRIGRDEFVAAWDEGWPQQPPALAGPVAAIYDMDTGERVWDSLHGDAKKEDDDGD